MTAKKAKKMSMNELEDFLGQIQEAMYKCMMNDLETPDKRSPQLYNAIIKELARNGIDCIPKAGDDANNALGELLKKVKTTYEQDYGDNLIN